MSVERKNWVCFENAEKRRVGDINASGSHWKLFYVITSERVKK
jgi:hypothetical protein